MANGSSSTPEQGAHASFYRRDIDGLRAVAILAVVVFHYFPQSLRGGFVGVDIFFVISGFLITGIILKSLEKGEFGFADFYARRIKRVFPALLLILISCYALGWRTLLSEEFRQLGKHIAAGAGFVANLTLLGESGYFDNAAETKPLLHLWSLGIEEQFYLLWPFILWGASKLKLPVVDVVAVLLIGSFALNLTEIDAHPAATFYTPQTRLWELLIGAMLACFPFASAAAMPARPVGPSAAAGRGTGSIMRQPDVRAICGVILIVAALVFLKSGFRFPGVRALLPAVGAALIISAGHEAWFNRKVLSSRLMVSIGLISYPLYLWHWPVLAFSRIIAGATPSWQWRLLGITLSFVLATLTYWTIEKRIKRARGSRPVVAALVFLMAATGYAGWNAYHRDGLPFRSLPKQAAVLAGYQNFAGEKERALWGTDTCFSLSEDYTRFIRNKCGVERFPGRPKVFLIGDSHSAYLSLGLRPYLDEKKYNLYQYSAADCVPYSIHDRRDRCRTINNYVRNAIRTEKPDYVILFAYYFAYQKNPDYAEPESSDEFFRNAVWTFKELGAKHIIVIGPMPTWQDALSTVLTRRFLLKGKVIPTRTFEGIDDRSLQWDAMMRKQSFPQGTTYLSLTDFLCNASGCRTTVGPDLSQDLIVRDLAHLTASGAKFITQNLLAPLFP